MYYLLSLLTGILISVMIAVNGGLTEAYGIYSATVFIHITGLLFISALVLFKRERPFSLRQPWFLYTGGVIGVMTTVFNNLAFGRISVSAILALVLLGQSIMGLIVDQYGLMGMPKHPFRRQKAFGLFLLLCGIASMINVFDMPAVLVSFAAGVSIVISRTLNAKLADATSVRTSTFFNYFMGLITTVPVFSLLGGNETPFANLNFSPSPYIYLGGIIGVSVIFLSNITVTKISAFYLSLALFLGQVFSGILIDAIMEQGFSLRNLIGGVFVAAGLCVNLLTDKKAT